MTKPAETLAQFYRAFNGPDLTLMAENWDNSDEIAMDNPLGGIKRGWPEIRSVYERIFNGGARVTVEFHDCSLHLCGGVFYAIGRECGVRETVSTKPKLTIRTTRTFRYIDGRWRQVHHHGSIDYPQLLAAYQDAKRCGQSLQIRNARHASRIHGARLFACGQSRADAIRQPRARTAARAESADE